jgi:wyosine [tRNA(Phe)-imidazoG37] synthetase (radical SAM superfamily)
MPVRKGFAPTPAILSELDSRLGRGESFDAIVFGGRGDPLLHRGIGAILRKIRQQIHLRTILLTDGVVLADKDIRRDAGEAADVVAYLPSPEDPLRPGRAPDRRRAFGHHVESVAALGRETSAQISLELPVHAALSSLDETVRAWADAVKSIRPARVFVIPHPEADLGTAPELLAKVRREIGPRAGEYLPDPGFLDLRCWCGGVGPKAD